MNHKKTNGCRREGGGTEKGMDKRQIKLPYRTEPSLKEENNMKRTFKKIALTSILSLSLATGSLMLSFPGAWADTNGTTLADWNRFPGMQGGMMNPDQGGNVALSDTAGDIVSGTTTNSAAALTADTETAAAITVTEEDSQVTISESGTYIITGSASSGGITVKKGTTGVVLILQDLDLTSTSGAALSVNKDSEVQIVVSGSVTLTDGENPEDENSEDAEVADAYDGAAVKIKAGASVYLTGDGTLTVNGSAKNGIKAGDEASLVIDGEALTVDITAANDGINANYDLTIASGTVTISAADDALHADRILTVGTQDGSTAPTVTVTSSTEGMEGTVINIHSGTVNVNAADDAINAANSDDLYGSELAYSINITGGDVTISSRFDGLDSNGNINLTGGTVTINSSAQNGGDAGIDYDGSLFISDSASLSNAFGIAGPDGMPGGGRMNGQMGGRMNGQMGDQMGGQMGGRMNGQMGGQRGGRNGWQMTPPDWNQGESAQENKWQMAESDQEQQGKANGEDQTTAQPDRNQMPMNGQPVTPPDFGQQGQFGPGPGRNDQGFQPSGGFGPGQGGWNGGCGFGGNQFPGSQTGVPNQNGGVFMPGPQLQMNETAGGEPMGQGIGQ